MWVEHRAGQTARPLAPSTTFYAHMLPPVSYTLHSNLETDSFTLTS